MRIAVAALITGLALAAQADGIYKWVDENGVVHFGSQPPQQKQVEVVKQPKSERYKQWQSEQRALMAQQQAAEAEAEPQAKVEAKPEPQPQAQVEPNPAEQFAREQRCSAAQSNLKELQSHARVREVDADGNQRVLGEDERQQRIAEAQQTIQDNC